VNNIIIDMKSSKNPAFVRLLSLLFLLLSLCSLNEFLGFPFLVFSHFVNEVLHIFFHFQEIIHEVSFAPSTFVRSKSVYSEALEAKPFGFMKQFNSLLRLIDLYNLLLLPLSFIHFEGVTLLLFSCKNMERLHFLFFNILGHNLIN